MFALRTSGKLKGRAADEPWFGLGIGSLVFVLVHSVLWAMALNICAGFRGLSQTVRMVGRNYGLSGLLRWTPLVGQESD